MFSFSAADHHTDSYIKLSSATLRSRVQGCLCIYGEKKTSLGFLLNIYNSMFSGGYFISYFITEMLITDTFAVLCVKY